MTYWLDEHGVYRITRSVADVWPEHRLDRIVTEAEHGETLMACGNHEGWVGTLDEANDHLLTEGPWAAGPVVLP